MKGWFDLFRDNGGPTLYAYSNRTPVIGDIQTITLYIAFTTLLLAFIVVFPGVRRERFTTFTSVILSLFVGVSILVGNYGASWHVAEGDISSAYRAFSNEKIFGRMGVYVGLMQVNITLMAMPVFGNDTNNMDDVNFNERFNFVGATQLSDEFQKALVKGLPFPILTAAEYLALDGDGFCWGRSYRSAGYYASIFLWTAFCMWLLMNMMLLIVPRYGAILMTGTGLMMLFVNLLYYLMLPRRPLQIHLENMILRFELGWCYWLVLVAGSLCLMIGLSITIIDLIYPNKFSTVLEVNYGTPFDRHTIIEDSHETKKKKKWVNKLEEPASAGLGGLLRRLSKRDRDRGDTQRNPMGEDNYAFEMENDGMRPAWRYPHLMFRDSRKSHHKSVSFKKPDRHQREAPEEPVVPGPHPFQRQESSVSTLGIENPNVKQGPILPLNELQKKFIRTDSVESSNSSLASFGLSLLYRNNSKKAQKLFYPPYPPSRGILERADTSSSIGSHTIDLSAPLETVEEVPAKDDSEEVTVVVSRRKTSITKAVRRSSTDHKRDEASMW